ncbi:PREDICTED: zinc finger protein 518B [Cyprinodon variegatus]|uniref:Zinc finger protein 518B n=1 Tax=Cyprinodon variegatus TaxID=28743 RepID=A0A3Q2C7R6_CYPVA|nr:PREDICTED: zinc finger protein 518B [Cyprinodon variegatus]XP_015243133.1 PREDICTED: zinc finger protein 518B [Cyprinodon variegatus]XP_015243134.1 PREDICTED: zinc finger protein 518B [Cyprinodon variegatus]
MKPVTYQSLPSSVNGVHLNAPLERLLVTSKVMNCEKCGFASTDPVALQKHMIEHGTRFYCFYCNAVSFSEAELNEHLKQHTAKYPFKCPHCGQGYMRRLCLVKHIDRLHSNGTNHAPVKPGATKAPPVTVSSALTSAPTADPLLSPPPRPVIRVAVPSQTAPPARLGKTLDVNVANTTNGNTERVSHLNGLFQPNRALTVSLPEEVNIPAGCLVELVEVKTVNGTKELKLRFVSQQENESVIKNTKPTANLNSGPEKSLSSTLLHPNTARSVSAGMCPGSRKPNEAKAKMNVAVRIPNSSTNVSNKEKVTVKRPSTEIINLDCDAVVPNKVPKTIVTPVREANSGIRVTQAAPANIVSSSSSVISGRVPIRLSVPLHPGSVGAKVPQRAVDERNNMTVDLSKCVPPRRLSDTNNVQKGSNVQKGTASAKLGAKEVCIRSNAASKEDKDVVCLDQQSTPASKSLRSIVPQAVQVRPPAVSVSNDNLANQKFPISKSLMKPLSVKPSVLSSHTNTKISPCIQEVRCKSVAKNGGVSEPRSFPVISSVFSLSEQPEGGKGPIQPLVMALRGIVMDKKHSTSQDQSRNGKEETRKEPASGQSVQPVAKNEAFTCEASLTQKASQCLKVEEQDYQQVPPVAQIDIHIKKEEGGTKTDIKKCSFSPALKSSTCERSAPASPAETPNAVDPLRQTDKSKEDHSSRFLTISLKRVQVGVWKKSKKGLKLGTSRCKPQHPPGGLDDCTVIYPMPLKEDQPVKRPGPNQPVVVLNHPKPRTCVQRTRADSISDAGASEATPKCQILKMRLSKGIGQSYEVMGCTVRDFP